MEQESIKDKLRKLAALAERGMAGEAANAKRALERLCKQYGVTLEEVMQDEKKKYRFKVGRNPILRQLFEQCYAVVLETGEIGYWAPTRDTIVVELTALQYADLMSMWKWHQANFEKDMDEVRKTMFRAYIDKHGLYAPSDGTEEHVLTPEEKERILKAMLMSETLGDERYQKMLTNSRK